MRNATHISSPWTWCKTSLVLLLSGFLLLSSVAEAAQTSDPPGAPRVIWMASPAPSGVPLAFSWILDWGVLGTTNWSVMNGETVLYTGTTFTPISDTSQSGNTTLTLADGSYNLAVKLCNAAGCTTGATFPLVVGANQDKIPTAPALSEIGNINPGANIPVVWNMWYGDIGSRWEVLIDGTNVHNSTTFDTVSDPAHVQKGSASLPSTGIANGAHTLVVKLCNGTLCSQDSKDFSIGGTPTPPAPGVPVVTVPATSVTNNVTLTWSLAVTPAGPKGTSWSVTDYFNGQTTTVYPSSDAFGPGDTPELQTGATVPPLNLARGDHVLTVRLCNTPAVCTNSAPAAVKIDTPPAPVPGAPVATIPSSTNGTLAISWNVTGNVGTYWELWNVGTDKIMRRFGSFADDPAPYSQKGTGSVLVANDTYTLKVKLCNTDAVCTDSNPQTVTVSGAPDKKAFFVAYYPTWFAPYYNAFSSDGNGGYTLKADAEIKRTALLSGGIPNYVTHVVLSFAKLNQMHLYNALSHNDNDLIPLGIEMVTNSASLKESIRVLKTVNPGTKVLLALGGAAYNDYWAGANENDAAGLKRLIVDLGLDGVDVDYEKGGADQATLTEYYHSIQLMRQAVDDANAALPEREHPVILTLAAWSTGADCTANTRDAAKYPQCTNSNTPPANNRNSFWGGSAGRELMVLQGMGAASMIDILSVMSYDAGYVLYDPVVAYQQYRAIMPADKQVALGLENSPQGWSKAITMVHEGQTCAGSGDANTPGGNAYANLVIQNQYGDVVPGAAYTIERFQKALQPGDGLMFWALFLENPLERIPDVQCNGLALPTVTEIGQAVSNFLGIGDADNPMKIDYQTAIHYGQ